MFFLSHLFAISDPMRSTSLGFVFMIGSESFLSIVTITLSTVLRMPVLCDAPVHCGISPNTSLYAIS
ncbi:MAG: hypothetical protein HN867_03955 [Deltaproteobacteria bacterium]|nr:hypothetical protein [Deltaproteobacteria bacterium]